MVVSRSYNWGGEQGFTSVDLFSCESCHDCNMLGTSGDLSDFQAASEVARAAVILKCGQGGLERYVH